MENDSDTKIWRYIDFAKFVSLLVTESLYFPRPSTFPDPYEGSAPRSHMKAMSEMCQADVDDIVSIKNQIVARSPAAKIILDKALADHKEKLTSSYQELGSRFGISCWHISEYESAAMWKLYSAPGSGIAIESTREKLKCSLKNRNDLVIARVRYMDFDIDPIEQGHKHYGLFLKRKSFEHEKELRATVRLPEDLPKNERGIPIECNLDTLINCIHVSPTAPPSLRDAVEALCRGKMRSLQKPVLQSKLYNAPDYGIEINVTEEVTK